ncbi:MAG TPA: tetratricopeptide repeat protein, partial [Pseudomonadales bacterium]|nr:tetratricopeptide repeat protein [Pseudomonadales bacterium]
MSESKFGRTRSEPELRAHIAGGSLDADDYLQLADLLKATSRFQEAGQVYQQALGLDLEHVEKARVAWELGSLLETSMGQRASARMMAHLALSLLSKQPESGDVLLLRGLSQSLLAHSVWFEDADAGIRTAHLGVESLQRVIRQYSADPAMGVAHYEVARLYNALGDPESAIGACREYLRSEPDRRSRLAALSVLAEALELAGRLPEAEIAVREGLSCVENDKGMLPNLYLTL